MTDNNLEYLNNIVQKTLALGADAVEAICHKSKGSSISCRLGEVEENESYENDAIGIRVFIGKRQASLSASGKTPEIAQKLVERSVKMAKLVPEDSFCGLADNKEICSESPTNLELYDEFEPTIDDLITNTKKAESTALENPKITNSEGASAGFNKSEVYIASSNGFASCYRKSSAFINLAVIAGNADSSESDYDSSSAVFFNDLDNPETIGKKASLRAVEMLGAKKIKTKEMPVVFDTRIANSLLSHFASAVSGRQIARGNSFLKEMMNQAVFNSNISIIDDPLILRGRRSRPFDAEGLPCKKEYMVTNGILKNWFLDLASARQLNLKSLAHASMSLGSSPYPSPSNLYIANGNIALNEICNGHQEIFLITSLSGQGVNIINGDYSRGAKGFIIKNGQIDYPVSEVTVSGNLVDIFKNIIPLNDLEFRFGFNSPSLFINSIMIAGK